MTTKDNINYWELGKLTNGIYPPNAELKFSPIDLDNEERFRKLKPSGWSEDSFTYKYNSNGFRSIEFVVSDKPSILALGCSFTCGVGLPFGATWVEQLGEHFPDYKRYNAGLGGGSADTVARLATNLIPILKPKIVAVLWPHQHRFETYQNGSTAFNGPWIDEPLNLQFEDNTSYNNQMKNKLIVDLLQKVYGFTLISLDLEKIFDSYGMGGWSKARDQAHFGADWQWQVAQDFYTEYIHK